MAILNNTEMIQTYLDLGWSLIPILPKTKTPAIKWAEYQEKRAGIEEVNSWLKKGWHLAVVTGDISGICVIDDDRVKHGMKEWGFDSPIISQSKSGGRHYYFKYDREIHTHCNTEHFIDLKAWHSYVLLPPFNGRVWIKEPSVASMASMASMDPKVEEFIRSDMVKDENSGPLVIADFLDVTEGSRGNDLYRIAMSIFNTYDYDTGKRLLYGVNLTYQPPLDEEVFEYNVARAYKYVTEHPKEESVKIDLSTLRKQPVVEQNEPKKIVSANDFLNMDFPQHVWLLDKLVRADGLNMIIGESGVGKSLICLTMAKAVVEGSFWVNEEFRAKKKKILLLDKENSEVDIQDHVRSLGINSDDFLIYMAAEYFEIMDTKCILTKEAVALKQFIEDNNVEVIIMDSMTDFYIGDENSAGDATANIQAWKKLFGDRALLAIHHENKPQMGGKKTALNRSRGSSAIVAQANSVISVSSSESSPEIITIEHAKVRGARKHKPFQVEMEIKEEYITGKSMVMGFKWIGEITPRQLASDKAREAVINFLKTDPDNFFTSEDIKVAISMHNFGANAIKTVFSNLKTDKEVEIVGEGKKGNPFLFKYNLDINKELSTF